MRQVANRFWIIAMIPTPEDVFYEGGPAFGDLAMNLLAAITIVGIPFTVGAIVRALWLRFRITNKRVSVTGGWLGRNKTQVAYNQIKELRSVPRGFGSWGDMVLIMNDGAKLEMRSVPKFRETENYILERIKGKSSSPPSQENKGFAE